MLLRLSWRNIQIVFKKDQIVKIYILKKLFLVKIFEHLIDFRKAENFFQLNRDMSLLDRYGEKLKDVQKYVDRIESLNTNILEKLDLSKKINLND